MTTKNIIADDGGKTELVRRLQAKFGLVLHPDQERSGGNAAEYVASGPNSDIPLFRVWMRRTDGKWQWQGRIEHIVGPNEVAGVNSYR